MDCQKNHAGRYAAFPDPPTRLRRLARAMAPVFRAQDVHREALAALLLFVEAAGREEADRRLVEHLTDYLHRARHDPRLRYGAGVG